MQLFVRVDVFFHAGHVWLLFTSEAIQSFWFVIPRKWLPDQIRHHCVGRVDVLDSPRKHGVTAAVFRRDERVRVGIVKLFLQLLLHHFQDGRTGWLSLTHGDRKTFRELPFRLFCWNGNFAALGESLRALRRSGSEDSLLLDCSL